MKEDIVFSRNTVEFVTVAAEFCAYMEKSGEQPRKEFVEGEKISYYRNNFDLGNVEYFSISEVKDNASVAV